MTRPLLASDIEGASAPSLRDRIAAEVERLIALLDAMEADSDFEPWLADTHGDDRESGDPLDEGEPNDWDGEPSLGAPERGAEGRKGRWAAGHGDDIEAVNEDGGDILDAPHDEEPDEPSLGWSIPDAPNPFIRGKGKALPEGWSYHAFGSSGDHED